MSQALLPGFSDDAPNHIPGYVFSSLTYEIKDKRSPLRRYFDWLVRDLDDIQAEYRASGGAMKVEWSGITSCTLGAAFDFEIRFRLDSSYDAAVARSAFLQDPDALDGVARVADRAQVAARSASWDELHAACWALALFTEFYRAWSTAGSPLWAFLGAGEMDVDTLLAATPSEALTEMSMLATLAEDRLLPHLEGPFHLGPTFAGSKHCRADADVVAGGCLLDVKTRVGNPNRRTRTYHDALSNVDVYQMLGYALFDLDDRYSVTQLGLYSARYGHLANWDLVDFMERVSGRSIDLDEERSRVSFILTGEGGIADTWRMNA
ncbi:MAG: hypothetical protein QM677_10250 [Microbacterium sp.]